MSVQTLSEGVRELTPHRIAGVLLTAADLIETKGHWTGGWHSAAPGTECAGTAVQKAATTTAEEMGAMAAIYAEIGRPKGNVWLGQVYMWNDRSSAEEVTSTLRSAAARLLDNEVPA